MATKSARSAVKDVRDVFADELDYANVTEFRGRLLPAVNDLERNPTKKYLITKHGKPLAVFLSFSAFEAIRKLVDAVLEEEDGKRLPQVLFEASQRMDRQRVAESGQPSSIDLSELVAQIQAVNDNVQRIESLLIDKKKLRAGLIR